MRSKALSANLRASAFGRPSTTRRDFRAQLEPLEVRQMLAGQDLLVSVYDDTAGLSVLRYNDVTYAPTTGSVATGDNSLFSPQGVAVGADGSFYVSNPATSTVSHYDVSGNYVSTLGAGTLALPGHLAINPGNGLLYVGDIGAGRIYEFNTSTEAIVGSIVLGYAPAGFDFVPDGTNDLVVGGFDTQGVIRYSGGGPSVLIAPGSGYNPLAILAEADGDVLVGDSDLGTQPTQHHQILIYSAATTNTTQFINLTFPVGTGGSAGYPPQPTALAYDHDGNLLVGLSPDHNGNGAIQKYDIVSGSYLGTLVSSIGAPTGMAFIDSINSDVASTHLFYRNSSKWNVTNGATFSDDNAIAPDKTAYLPGSGTSAFSAVSSYSRGLNGMMVDINGPHGTITSGDFIFKVGNNNSPSTWATATAPTIVTTRAGAGVGGSDRVELIWNDDIIKNTWLEVIVKGDDALGGSNTNTGLASSYVFYFGNALGDSGSGNSGAFQTTSADEINARNNPKTFTATRSDVNDFNRDGSVNSSDQIIARNNPTNLGNQLKFLVVGGGGPFAPAAVASGGGDQGIASALAATVPVSSTATADTRLSTTSTTEADQGRPNAPAASGPRCEQTDAPVARRQLRADQLAAEIDIDEVLLVDQALANLGLK